MNDAEKIKSTPIAIDKVRASKAGHAFHEAWAARSALELLLPSTDLAAIALEGFAEQDEEDLGLGAVEIADLVRYHGARNVARATRVSVVQFKYSIASADRPVRAADIAKTLTKFAVTDAELREKHGDRHVLAVVDFEFATNRPIHEHLSAAVTAIVSGAPTSGDIAHQAKQLVDALKDYAPAPSMLLSRLSLVGSKGSLREVERSVSATLAAWSEASDPEAEKRLLKLRNLVRTKAGPGSDADKTIDRVAVLAELDIENEERLYPTLDAFPDVADVVERRVFDEAATVARQPGLPLIVHATGGMGKTVLMQGLADRLASDGPIVLFDGFGAGRWRDPADNRHLPDRTLVHLANLLAGQGLCDILLPIADVTGLLKAFRRRLSQAVATARQTQPDAVISLILDAIDHAGLAAQDTATQSFAHLFLRSIGVTPIEGVRIVASCRTERIPIATGGAPHRALTIPPFTDAEARSLISRRVADATAAEVAALIGRSGRNPRVLDNLIVLGRPFDPVGAPDESEGCVEQLDTLLRQRLDRARDDARARGASAAEIDLLLSGIALLAPPVPIEELAAAHGLVSSQVESFAADLAPLLERTPHGLMFRDEPIETLIRSTYGNDAPSRQRVVAALVERQPTSSYAARALPALLTALRDADQLITLAYDPRVPAGASLVSTRDIRLSRVTAAIALCAELHRRDDLLGLLVEASLIAAGHERSDRFLYEFPDLAAISGDPEAARRLAMTYVGWPGGKHAALALASAFSGDLDEARRHARRSIDWHNWASQATGKTRFNERSASQRWDDVGFAYVEMLVGNDIRVAEFFAKRGDAEAYSKFDDLFDLFDRHRHSAHPPIARIAERLGRCRLSSRALYVAALRYWGNDPAIARRLIAGLARSGSEGEPTSLGIPDYVAAAHAIDLGLGDAAAAILASASPTPRSLYDFTSYFPLERSIDEAILGAGVRAAQRRRPAALIDILPAELRGLVPASAMARGAAAVEQVLERKLAQPKQQPGRRRRRPRGGPDEAQRSEYSRALTGRVRPLLAYAQAAADIVRSPRGEARHAVVATAFDALVSDVAGSSDFNYRDNKGFRARIGFKVIFSLADALGALDPTLARRMVEWVADAQGLFIPDLMDIVTRLSRKPELHDAALLLAGHVDTKIALDTDVGTRVSLYGDLARAVWRVSVDEAAAYFRRALDLAEAIGSDDFDRTNHLLELTGHYQGPELAPEAAHSLARILELNLGEDDHFPWTEYARTMVPIAGRGMLAMIARLDDRRTTRLGLALGPALMHLVKVDKLSPDIAAALSGLAAPIETWTWRVSDLAADIASRLPAERLEWYFALMLVELDRDDQLSPARETIAGLARLAESYLPPVSPARRRIAALLARRGLGEMAVPRGAPPSDTENAPAFPIDLTNPDDIDRRILEEEPEHASGRWPVRTLLRLAEQAATPSQRLGYVRAVVEANAASLADKLLALDDHLEPWSATSAAMRDELPVLGLRLATKHAAELANIGSDGWSSWRDLVRYFRADRARLVEHVVTALRGEATSLGGNAWLALGAKLAPAAGSAAIGDALARFLTTTAEKLPTEVGDGPWDDGLAVPLAEADVVAGLIWARLGSPLAAARWRAAHAARRFAALDRFDVVDRLVAAFTSARGMPFADAKLPFFAMHAQLWLLIALARIAKDHPAALVRHQSFLEDVAFSRNLPHVVMQAFAADALREIATVLPPADDAALTARLATVNRSPRPHAPRANHGEFRYRPRPESSSRSEDNFSLDYDFTKYQVEGLCRVFGCPGWEVEDRISALVRSWNAEVRSMYDGHRGDDSESSWSGGYVPGHDQYGGYLAWHALMLVAGEFLATRIVVGEDWSGDAWAAFLKGFTLSRDDGCWLADLTDLFPLDLPKEADLPMPDRETPSNVAEDHALLAPLLGLAGGKLAADWLPVAARWSVGHDTTARISSVVANADDARSTVMTLLSDEPFFRWLPDDDDEVERHFGRDGHSVQAWLHQTPNPERQLDRYDPYACNTALHRPFPALWMRESQGVVADDDVVRHWSVDGAPAYRAKAWGVEGGRGEHAWSDTGYRLSMKRDVLLSLLARTSKSLVIALKLQKYHKRTSYRHSDHGGGGFSHRTMVAVITARGAVRAPRRVSQDAKAAIANLGSDRPDFYHRFRAIAGLPDEWLAKREALDLLPDLTITIEGWDPKD